MYKDLKTKERKWKYHLINGTIKCDLQHGKENLRNIFGMESSIARFLIQRQVIIWTKEEIKWTSVKELSKKEEIK